MTDNRKKVFEDLVEQAKNIKEPKRVVLAGADNENMVKGLFMAADAGFVKPILVGKEPRVQEMVERLGFQDREYELHSVYDNANVVQYSIEMIEAGHADILLRGNTQTRDFLMPILNPRNHLVRDDCILTQINIMALPEYSRLLAISDVTLLITPSMEQKKKVVQNMVRVLNAIGIQKPNIAMLSLVEKPSFHMKDTVEAQTIVKQHMEEPIADCNLVGPISFDLIISKEAARLKNYNCPYCGEFDGIVVPSLIAGNLLVKDWYVNLHATGCGIIAGAKVPIAITGRSEPPENTYLSLAACVSIHEND
ncbi:MAG: hypothetical protein J6D36_09955 [Erysipelotrichaceae bacterium]|nr:hypothetical protein [Erysipelotrichaceae bacterium]